MSIHLNNRAAALNFKSMQTYSPHKAAIRPEHDASNVMVAVVAGPEAQLVATAGALPRWRALTPLALWSTLPLRDASRDEVLRSVAALLARHDIHAHQLILLTEGKTGRTALELVLQGALDCAAILAIAVPCAALPFPILPTAAALRLVVDCDDARADLISALRDADIDARIIRLGPAASRDVRTVASAAETFVLELVANASRPIRHQGRLQGPLGV
jgi:hypothetical protein